jgi:hypothetical protein
LVTTKKGKKNAGAVLTYNGQGGVQVPNVGYKPVHAYENAILRNEAVVNAGLTPIYSPEQIRQFQAAGRSAMVFGCHLEKRGTAKS